MTTETEAYLLILMFIRSLNFAHSPPGILTIDVQFSEHPVLEGADQIPGGGRHYFVEASLKRFIPGILVHNEMIEFLPAKGFEYFDYAGQWRDWKRIPSAGRRIRPAPAMNRPLSRPKDLGRTALP